MILAGDVGGTHSRLALFGDEVGAVEPMGGAVYASGEFGGLVEIVERFVGEHSPTVTAACFGIAGPVVDGVCRTPNLPWEVEAAELATVLGLARVGLVNDLKASAYSIVSLGDGDLVELHRGQRDPEGNVALISAGTGLGEAGLVRVGEGYEAMASEGGHSDFAARDDLEVELFGYLRRTYEHVSVERVLSGPGLVNVFEFLTETGRGEVPAGLRHEISAGDAAAVIAGAGMSGRDEVCAAALGMFVSFYGAEAGNLALKLKSTGGVYLGGGIAPKILDQLKGATFLDAFMGKGRMRGLLEAMPIHVIVNDQTTLLGTAGLAREAR